MSNIYFIQDVRGPIKIGSCKETKVNRRVVALQVGNPYKLTVLAFIINPSYTEQELHKRFSRYNLMGEWFEPSSELLEFIDSIKHTSEEDLKVRAYNTRRWTSEELIYLKDNYNNMNHASMATYLDRTTSSVYNMARRMGLEYNPIKPPKPIKVKAIKEHKQQRIKKDKEPIKRSKNDKRKVFYDSYYDKWIARWKLFTTSRIIGMYDTKEQALDAYREFLYMDRDKRVEIEISLPIEEFK